MKNTKLKLFTNDVTRFIPIEYLSRDVRLYKKTSGWYTIMFEPHSFTSKEGLDGSYIELVLTPTPEKGEILHICKFLSDLIVV